MTFSTGCGTMHDACTVHKILVGSTRIFFWKTVTRDVRAYFEQILVPIIGNTERSFSLPQLYLCTNK